MRTVPCIYCGRDVSVLFRTCPHCFREIRGRAAPALVKGTRECTLAIQWWQSPHLAPAWTRYPPFTIDADGNHEFLEYNPGWIAISGPELRRRIKEGHKVSIGHDDPEKVAQRVKDMGYIEAWYKLGSRLYVKGLKEA